MKKSECYERAVRAVIACTGGDISADDMDVLYFLLSNRHYELAAEEEHKTDEDKIS